ncbi:23S rRNA (guanosine(2251)-2'-O)-methyltransferase RlmB [Iodidimonas gelatinilytica]|uniref:23S rRNA (Guanosine(2251)-2'-O)-methyltransferase RlmB n=1 Tax=Iodidimonas gelatinilytica TaxID=1236966 RepID=A0A5A7MTN9_9PROT|nr:23S rRNA (guanosine(2251)-2'-O)-methyltransferase RlmB [Iodidimonas gelatinilytica]GEQ99362.1 23S rRNA (guanosine(2251)-2'-O)-methyltransferase RlmB [Iodidimonas gelatinilytica]
MLAPKARYAYSEAMAQQKKSRRKTPGRGPAPEARKAPEKRRTAPTETNRPNKRAPGLLLFGKHAVAAALLNPKRQAKRLYATKNGLDALTSLCALPTGLPVEITDMDSLKSLVSGPNATGDSPTQGVVLEVLPLPGYSALDFPPKTAERSVIVVLDQVEDPHNVGAILRSAAVFGAQCLITQDRHVPPESGVLAKSASGALDVVPWVRVTNIAATLDELAQMGYWRVGLAGEGEATLEAIDLGPALVLVLGAEGRGLRPLVRKHCDMLAKIPLTATGGLIDSLNVSNAAAVALYALTQGKPKR